MLDRDLIGADASALDECLDIVLAGDICYEQPTASRAVDWLRRRSAEGAQVLLGDPGRTYLPRSGLRELATYRVQTTRELEDSDVRRTTVWAVDG